MEDYNVPEAQPDPEPGLGQPGPRRPTDPRVPPESRPRGPAEPAVPEDPQPIPLPPKGPA